MSSAEERYRLLDAGLNRAAEGLRVAEDICRFGLNLQGFSGELKVLRHELLANGHGRRDRLLEERNIEGDVGRRRPADLESQPAATLTEVALRNLRRVCEALRTLEEVSRLDNGDRSARFESLRYRVYSLEKGLASLSRPRPATERLRRGRLYLLATQSLCPQPLEAAVTQAVEAGVDIVQLREKSLPDREALELARRLREITAKAGALLIINDRPDLALLSHADGVHLGQNDLPVAEARSLTGGRLLIGVSTHSVEDARKALREGADYIGVGPMFPTTTKDAGPLLGPAGLREVLAEVHVPAFAVGGVSEETLPEVLAAGGRRVAISSAILSSGEIAATVASLRRRLEED